MNNSAACPQVSPTGEIAHRWKQASVLATCVAIIFCLYLTSQKNYLLFHCLVEFFSVGVACCIFMIAWNARRFLANDYLLFIGIASLSVAVFDFLHMLAYKGMGVFIGSDANLPTQLWIIGRYLGSLSLLVAPLFVRRKLQPLWMVAGYTAVTAVLLASVFAWQVFPDCFVPGKGLTIFKILSEYLTIVFLFAGLLLLWRKQEAFDRDVFELLVASILLLALTGFSFTLYVDVYGMANMTGHLLKGAAYYFIYRALVQTGLSRPYALLFRELKQSEERYRLLYQNTPAMIHSIDREGRLVNMSNYWLEQMGYDRSEVIGHKSMEFMTEESRHFAEETILPEFLRTGMVKEAPYQMVLKHGEVRDVLITASAERDVNGDILQSLSVITDITEQKQAERAIKILNSSLEERNLELEETNGQLEAFNYTVSHDLRGPLTNINGSSQAIIQLFDKDLSKDCMSLVEVIYRQSLRMNKLLDTLLDFSRVAKVPLAKEPVNLSWMAQDILVNLLANEPDRRVSYSVAEGVIVEGDENLLRVALDNLLGNAWKYSSRQEDARIEFGRTEVNGMQVCFVRDNGVGFSMDQADMLFRTFQRLSTSAAYEGTGIGLATVQRIVQRHGGSIWAEGAEGKGASFFFSTGGITPAPPLPPGVPRSDPSDRWDQDRILGNGDPGPF